jgi:hypothetical protein
MMLMLAALAASQVACSSTNEQPADWKKTTIEGPALTMCAEVQFQAVPAKIKFADPPPGFCVTIKWIGHDGEQIGSSMTLAHGGTFIGPPGSSYPDTATAECPTQGLTQSPSSGVGVGVTGLQIRGGTLHYTNTGAMPLFGEFLAGKPIQETVAAVWANSPDSALSKARAIVAGDVLPPGVDEATRLEVVAAPGGREAEVRLQSSTPLASAALSIAGVSVVLPPATALGNGWWQVSVGVDENTAPPGSEVFAIWESTDGLKTQIEAVIVD